MSLDIPFYRTFPPPPRLLDSFNTNQERSFPPPSPRAHFRLILQLEKTEAFRKTQNLLWMFGLPRRSWPGTGMWEITAESACEWIPPQLCSRGRIRLQADMIVNRIVKTLLAPEVSLCHWKERNTGIS
jgi:hypothetical protein